MTRQKSLPKLCKHSASGRAVVRIGGKDHYCGRFGTRKALAEYHRLLAEYLEVGGAVSTSSACTTVSQVAAAYLKYCIGRIRSAGHLDSIKGIVRLVHDLYGPKAPDDFGPLALKVCRSQMIKADLTRSTINQRIRMIRAMFAWAGENEMIDGAIAQRLKCVKGLRWGEGGKEPQKRRPAPEAAVVAVKLASCRQIAAMIELQWLSGMRPCEVVAMTTGAIDTTGAIWEYHVPDDANKTVGTHDRVVQLGKAAQRLLGPWLRSNLAEPLFSPVEAENERKAKLIAERKARGGVGNHKRRARKPQRRPGRRYTVGAYRTAIRRTCDRLGIDVWTPHQLRHSFATRVRKQFGLDAARAALGHVDADVTLDYAELDRGKAATVAEKIG